MSRGFANQNKRAVVYREWWKYTNAYSLSVKTAAWLNVFNGRRKVVLGWTRTWSVECWVF